MEIRELQKQDLYSLLELYIQLDEKNKSLEYEKSLSTWQKILKEKNIKYIGAIEKQKVVATCYCVLIPNLTNKNRSICFIENVITDKDFRRRGLARLVIQKAIEIAKENNCYKIILESSVHRTEAHKFYESIGFKTGDKKSFLMWL